MKLNSRFAIASAVVVAGLFSGCGPAWKVIKASNPTTLEKSENVALAFDYSQMQVGGKSVADFKAAKIAEEPKYAQTWDELINNFEAAVLKGVQGSFPNAHFTSAGPGDTTVTVRPTRFSMGKYIVVAATSTVMNVNVGARSSEGEDSDEIQFVRSYAASVIQPSVFNHIPYVGQDIGRVTAQFLSSKKAGK